MKSVLSPSSTACRASLLSPAPTTPVLPSRRCMARASSSSYACWRRWWWVAAASGLGVSAPLWRNTPCSPLARAVATTRWCCSTPRSAAAVLCRARPRRPLTASAIHSRSRPEERRTARCVAVHVAFGGKHDFTKRFFTLQAQGLKPGACKLRGVNWIQLIQPHQ
jgi:hypothetical protein